MDEQPEALRLANLLEKAPAHTLEDGIITLYLGGTVVADQAAAELRRLHAQNAELLGALNLAAEQLIENRRVAAHATIVDALVKAEAGHD